jgi:histidinol-phosphatase (PHP family)
MIELYDGHVHTLHSTDAGLDNAVQNCIAALRAGLSGIAITDHCDMGTTRDDAWRQRLEASVHDAVDARERFAGRLRVAVGVELGQPLHEPNLAAEALSSASFDVVLGSLHNLKDQSDFFEIGSVHPDKRALLTAYFTETLDMVTHADFDVLTHLTYPFRYLGNGEDTPSVREFEEILRAIFAQLAQRGKALECNLSGLFSPRHGKTMPELWELKLFRACKGELVTLGSDAHRAVNIGREMAYGVDLLRLAGFENQVFYSSRKPHYMPLY